MNVYSNMVSDFTKMSPTAQTTFVVVAMTMMVQSMRWLWWYRTFFKFFMKLPGEKDFSWFWGNIHKFRDLTPTERIEYFSGLCKRHPKFYRIWLGPLRPVVNFNHPDTVKELLKTSEPKPLFYGFAIPWLGEGLLIAGGAKWARSRRLLTPAFHFDILKPYVEVGNRASDVLLSKVDKYSNEGKSIEMVSNISLCTLDTILLCAMSYTDDVQTQGESHPYVQAVTELTELWAERGRHPLMIYDVFYGMSKSGKRFHELCNFVHGISEKVIRERQQSLARDGPPKKRYLDFLDILLTAKDDTGKGMTPLEIRNEVDTFMFEGHDTTASAISWILYSLCEHPEYQQKVQQEIDTILQGRDSDDILWGDLPKLEYTTMAIKEGMRLHSPVPFISRCLTKPATVEGVTFPVGTNCTINIFNVHHNPTVWSDPWTFNPDRFLPENIKKMDTYAFIPFSAGPRNCIGQHFAMNEEKVMLCRLLRRYTFHMDHDYPVKKHPAAVMRSESGMRMFATPRKPTL